MNMKKLILISVIIHVILIVVLAPVIKTRMEFDEKKEVERTGAVKEREAQRKEQDRLQREKQKLDEKTAKMLKREAELRKKEEIKQQVTELRKKRDEMMEHRDKELERFRERTAEDVLRVEKKAIERVVDRMAKHIAKADRQIEIQTLVIGAFYDNGGGLSGKLDDISIYGRLLSEGEIGAFKDLPKPAAHFWDFEDGVLDAVSGERGEAVTGGAIKPRGGEGEGSAFQGNSSYGRANLGRFDLGDQMTFSVWINTSSKKGGQVVFSNNPPENTYSGLTLVIEGQDASNGAIVLRSNKANSKNLEARTVGGALPFEEWVNVIVTVNKPEGVAAIYVNGKMAEMVSTEVDKETYTADENIDKLKELTEEVVKQFKEETPEELNKELLDGKLEEVKELIEKTTAEVKELNGVRSEMNMAKREIERIQEQMKDLEGLTDMAKMNDTAAAKAEEIQPPVPADDNTANSSQMYNEAEGLEKQIAAAKADIDAAGEAVSQNTSYAEAREKAMETTPSRPDLTSALSGEAPGTVGELNEFRENLNRAENEMQDMNARADSALGNSQQQSLSAASFATGAAMSAAASQTQGFGQVVDMTAFGSGAGGGDSQEMRKDESDDGMEMAFSNMPQSLRIDEGKIIRAAMPGRRFTQSSTRKGWLYLDTWYVIGPWENKSVVDYTVKHPPEFGIDFDAKYYDGKFASRAGHPDETLKWEFYQSDQVRCQPPRVYAASTYYAYTDVWFEEARDMLIAVASDDASSVWLNGQIVWQDVGQSAWQLGEGYRKVHFKQGFNDVLVRIENGPVHCVWSVVLCPPEMLNK